MGEEGGGGWSPSAQTSHSAVVPRSKQVTLPAHLYVMEEVFLGTHCSGPSH